jgi:cytidyltransferase-like protein
MNERTVLTIGTFDLLHRGHVNLLQRAAGIGTLHVGVNSDAFVRSYKGRLPVQAQAWRAELLGLLPFVAAVHISDGPGDELIRHLEPDFLVADTEWFARGYLEQIGMHLDELEEMGCALVFLPRTAGVSTSQLRESF